MGGQIRAHLLRLTRYTHTYLYMHVSYIYVRYLYWICCDSPDWTWHGMSSCPSFRTRCHCPRDGADADDGQLLRYPQCPIFAAYCDTCAYHAWPDYSHASGRSRWWPARWTRRWIHLNWIRLPRPRLSILQRDLSEDIE